MNNTKLLVLIVIGLLVVSVTVSAIMLIPRSDKGDENKNDKAPDVPPGLQKIVFIHYKKGFASPFCNDNGVCEQGEKKNCADCRNGGGEEESTCYAFLGKGVKWRDLPQNYVIDPDNEDGLSQSFIVSAITAGTEEWDAHTSTNLFGSYSIDHSATWDGWINSVPDGENEMVFDDYPQAGVIAVTVTWGYFTGKPSTRRIIEFDILYDTDFVWGDGEADSSVMDLQNIAVHEVGHGIGLGDLYNTGCIDETMYGYSGEGDIEKRDLNTGDIAGLHILYGP
ncbi:matrixin family metalloprotease [Candidatus Woesearchaeota archaeon]|nr:matrixin family metalloprotease [Candidatus Woesearchaeota archaeon]